MAPVLNSYYGVQKIICYCYMAYTGCSSKSRQTTAIPGLTSQAVLPSFEWQTTFCSQTTTLERKEGR
jgi:hypothetical protein